MPITYFGSSSNPADADAATLSATPVAVTPPASMVAGDLVVLIGQQRGTGTTIAMSALGGQTWTTALLSNTASNLSVLISYCRYNGTWAANPSMSFSNSTCTTVVMHVFRPSSSSNLWGIDTTGAFATFVAPVAPNDVTASGITTTNSSTVSVFGWFTFDDNTWALNAGSNFVISGSAQYRNLAGSDMSSTYAHCIQTAAGATGSVTKQQASLGPDAGGIATVAFYEYSAGGAANTSNMFFGAG
ncbi:MAG: hypothetical protein M3367_02865 [Acidobacteriota bacterium]|nr:hypothetical protein [Acidobacteriota bacterium]